MSWSGTMYRSDPLQRPASVRAHRCANLLHDRVRSGIAREELAFGGPLLDVDLIRNRELDAEPPCAHGPKGYASQDRESRASLGTVVSVPTYHRVRGRHSRKEAAMAAKKPASSGKDWTRSEVAQLKKELKSNTPTRVVGLHLKRTPSAVQQKANSLGLSTKPTNESPYGTGGKRRGR